MGRRKTHEPKRNDLFNEFWRWFPRRNGRKLEKAVTLAKFNTLSRADQALCVEAVQNYAKDALIRKGIGVRDPKRFLKDDFWREWLHPTSEESDYSGIETPL